MPTIENDSEYLNLVDYILDSEEFNKIDLIEHHGITRKEHSVKVSYYSYRIAKTLRLNYKDVARGGLLHDFFLSNDERTLKERFISTFVHPKKALKHANEIFGVNEREADIITGHMFPINIHVPKSSEAWIVNIVDKIVGGYELCSKCKFKLSYTTNLYAIFFINMLLR